MPIPEQENEKQPNKNIARQLKADILKKQAEYEQALANDKEFSLLKEIRDQLKELNKKYLGEKRNRKLS